MKDNGIRTDCGRSDDIVAYIYDEIATSDRESFEKHLAACMSCTDEFAAVSDARFSVFEWHKEEFADLPTPEFVLPREARTNAATGLFAAIVGIIRNPGWMAPALAAILVFAGIGFVMFTASDSEETNVARVEIGNSQINGNVSESSVEETRINPDVENTAASESENVPVASESKSSPNVGRPAVKRTPQKSQRSRNVPPASPTMGRAPVLSQYEENEDRSLRLSDLLDEVGG